jgi:hypothetical protein
VEHFKDNEKGDCLEDYLKDEDTKSLIDEETKDIDPDVIKAFMIEDLKIWRFPLENSLRIIHEKDSISGERVAMEGSEYRRNRIT